MTIIPKTDYVRPEDPSTCPVPYHKTLWSRFQMAREDQARDQDRDLTQIDALSSRVVFEVGVRAVMDVHSFEENPSHSSPSMRVVSLSTGTGKSNSAKALIAAYCRFYNGDSLPRDEFSAAYVVPTVILAKEVLKDLNRLLRGTGERAALWSSELDTVGGDRSKVMDQRVLVYCHAAWKQSMKDQATDGFRFYKGKRRKLVFVDEQPDLVTHVHVKPSDIQTFYQDVQQTLPGHPAGPLLASVVARMNALIDSEGQMLTQVTLLSEEEGFVIGQLTAVDLAGFVHRDTPGDLKAARRSVLESLRDFLVAAAYGGCFYSRHSQMFTGFRLDFDAGPGHVLLDATADIDGYTHLRQDLEQAPAPQVDFRNLQAVLVNIPKRWRRVRDLIGRKLERKEALEFGDWVRNVIVQHTKPGADVLMFAPLPIYNADILSKAPDPKAPYDLQGRSVNTEHHGTGVGRNVWKSKQVVVTVGHHFVPRHVTVANLHGWTGRVLTDTALKQAEGRLEYGDVFKPQGDYGLVHEGHALRWHKQETMRGNARNFNADGSCGEMLTIIFATDPNLILRHWSSLYPGAPLPKTHGQATDKTSGKKAPAVENGARGYAGLSDYLKSFSGPLIDGVSIADKFGIRSYDLKAAIQSPAIQVTAITYGWTVAKAKQVNKPGRGNYLVNWQRYAQETAAENVMLASRQSGLSG